MNEDKIELVAKIQKNELKNDCFLSECSIRFIALFYKQIIKYDSTILCVNENSKKEIRGFVFCTTNSQGYENHFLKKTIFQILFYPSIYFPMLKVVMQKIMSANISNNKFNYDCEIAHFAVDKQYQRTGIGKSLIMQVEEELRKRKIKEYHLQVFSDNLAALGFYESVGMKVVNEFSKGNRKKKLMFKKISS